MTPTPEQCKECRLLCIDCRQLAELREKLIMTEFLRDEAVKDYERMKRNYLDMRDEYEDRQREAAACSRIMREKMEECDQLQDEINALDTENDVLKRIVQNREADCNHDSMSDVRMMQDRVQRLVVANKKLLARLDIAVGAIRDMLCYFEPRGGVSDVPLGPFERMQEALIKIEAMESPDWPEKSSPKADENPQSGDPTQPAMDSPPNLSRNATQRPDNQKQCALGQGSANPAPAGESARSWVEEEEGSY